MYKSRDEMLSIFFQHPKGTSAQNEAFLDILLKKDTRTLSIFFQKMKDSRQEMLLDRDVVAEIKAKISGMK